MRSRSRSLAGLAAIAALLTAVAGCGTSALGSGAASGKLQVVAAESFWGSIAAQLGGSRVAVKSIIVNPDTDPHAYEPTATDAVAMARSRLAIVNGIGYDRWASQLLSADAGSRQTVLDVGDLLGLKPGANPHQWYAPASVQRVIRQIVADYQRLDSTHAAYFERRRVTFEQQGLARYKQLLAEIRGRFRGVPVGYSESIFQPLGQALGLRLVTPANFARAVAEGADVTASDKQTVDQQASARRIKVWIYNRQNATPDVQQVNQIARAAGIPITTITETLSPASATFEQWQANELQSLLQALHRATGR